MRPPSAALALILLLASASACALETVDTLQSSRQRVQATAHWLTADADSDADLNRLIAIVEPIEYRLDVSKRMKRRVNLYLSLPVSAVSPNGMELHWQSSGSMFRAGSVKSGSKTMVWSGIITRPLLVEQLRYTVYLDAQTTPPTLEITPIFLLEVLPE